MSPAAWVNASAVAYVGVAHLCCFGSSDHVSPAMIANRSSGKNDQFHALSHSPSPTDTGRPVHNRTSGTVVGESIGEVTQWSIKPDPHAIACWTRPSACWYVMAETR